VAKKVCKYLATLVPYAIIFCGVKLLVPYALYCITVFA
jgi:hypothetical protein